jgi:glycosyltransferase involved in cell wall biosynthesis
MSILRHPLAGTARWATGLVRALKADDELEIEEWLGPPRLHRGGVARKVGNLLRERAWFGFGLPRAARHAEIEVLLMPANLTASRIRIPQVVTIHDVNFLTRPGTYDADYARYAEREFRRSARRAARITTVSHFSRAEIAAYLGVDPSRIDVVYPGLDAPPAVAPGPATWDRAYALYVGATAPHKDISTAIRAWRHLADTPLGLAIVGQPGRDHANVLALANESRGRVVVVGRVSDEELERWYSHASVFVFPSEAEGFGYPPLEAMLRGVPVVASRAASRPEVLGSAALYFEVGKDEGLAEQVRRVWTDEPLRRQLVDAGARQAALYTWARTGEMVGGILKDVAAQSSHS